MATPDWNDLRYFLAIARGGSLAGAARHLGVNHSTVFRRLNAFEGRLGARLFDRLAAGYRLTAAGERLRPRAERVEAEIDALAREVAGLDERLAGPVRLTTAPNLARSYVAGYLAALREQAPGIEVSLTVSARLNDLSKREADVALRATSAPPEHLVGRRVVRIEWWFHAGEGWLARYPAPSDAAALTGLAWIAPDDGIAHLPAFRWAARHLSDADVIARSDDLDAMAALAVAGLGLVLLPRDQIVPGLVPLFPLTPAVHTDLWLLTHPDLRQVPRISAVMAFLASALAREPRLSSSTAGVPAA